jgi:hypothetical protein
MNKIDLFETPLLKIIRERENLSENSFHSELSILKKTLSFLISEKIFKPRQILDLIYQSEKHPDKNAKNTLKSNSFTT